MDTIQKILTLCYRSLIMCPHTQNLYHTLFSQDLVYQPVLNIDSSRVSTLQIAHQFFKNWWAMKRFLLKN